MEPLALYWLAIFLYLALYLVCMYAGYWLGKWADKLSKMNRNQKAFLVLLTGVGVFAVAHLSSGLPVGFEPAFASCLGMLIGLNERQKREKQAQLEE